MEWKFDAQNILQNCVSDANQVHHMLNRPDLHGCMQLLQQETLSSALFLMQSRWFELARVVSLNNVHYMLN
jgi:hypothetical protein